MPEQAKRAVLMAVKTPDVAGPAFEASLSELSRLVSTLGYEIVARVTQQRDALSPAAVLGEGKLKELSALTGGDGKVGPRARTVQDKARLRRMAEEEARTPSSEDEDADEDAETSDDQSSDPAAQAHADGSNGDEPGVELVAVDHDLTPSQLRNLERATGVDVLDRTGIIIEIFHRHAQSRQARLEVEIARLTYAAPRLRESPRGKERQQGRGAGDTALELDRRRIRDRISELKEQIERIQREDAVRRSQRRHARRVALVGYTNAGKSSWMRALTESQVLVENKLFATLDTTVRALSPETRPRILMSDTVGFIRRLPHDLVASFKSTLDEALEASLLIHVVDASDADWEAQLAVTTGVLSEIGAGQVPFKLLMNKIDLVDEAELAALRNRFPDAWFVSARDAADVSRVRENIIGFFESRYVTADFEVPYNHQRLVSEMHESGRVLEERYEPEGVMVRLSTDPETAARLRAELSRAE